MDAECGQSITLPDGQTMVCSAHRSGWHLARYRATWPELADEPGAVCGSWAQSSETASGRIWVMCGKMPGHTDDPHYGRLGGLPYSWWG